MKEIQLLEKNTGESPQKKVCIVIKYVNCCIYMSKCEVFLTPEP